ncbi:MAG: DNA mismatch repair endonuclease MutL, partial [Planctomycetaceae bacterium]|nr:DNA mismatch repair endonuclease MutL [Planctomycetaceae bacterium]
MPLLTEAGTRIQKLSASVVNKIAAGEVIERPASVLKELLENSVDALATRIEIDLEQGGSELIRISDDGEGIHPDDLELAVTSHATSKIRDADDLFRVHTLGFRGEALASIAEVSRFRIRSRPHDQEIGRELDVEGGIVKDPRPAGCAPGTCIEVRELFVNTPVRRKFLKSASTEFSHAADHFTRIALANPRLHLVLRHNNKLVHELPATDRFLDRAELFFGNDLAKNLIPVESEHNGIRLWGYVAHPSQSKATRKGQHLFLNGRWIQDRSLQHALSEAYRGLLMVGRYPIAFLFLEMPPDLVDVNVHPCKFEVRFQDSQRLYRQLLSTLRTRFLGMNLDSTLSVEGRGSSLTLSPVPSRPDPHSPQVIQAELAFTSWAKEQLANWKPNADLSDLEAVVDELDRREAEQTAARQPTAPWMPFADVSGQQSVVSGPQSAWTDNPDESKIQNPKSKISSPTTPSSDVRALQVHDCYLVVETGEGLTVIDQHALHERILYEHFRRRVLANQVEVQRLLMPVPIELSAREAALVLDQAEVLNELGLTVEPFGGQTVAVTGYPTLLSKADPAELLKAVVEHLDSTGQQATRRDLIDSLLHMMACKAAIKAGHRLSPEEIESLLAQRHLV